jgi:hypothetical protein
MDSLSAHLFSETAEVSMTKLAPLMRRCLREQDARQTLQRWAAWVRHRVSAATHRDMALTLDDDEANQRRLRLWQRAFDDLFQSLAKVPLRAETRDDATTEDSISLGFLRLYDADSIQVGARERTGLSPRFFLLSSF